MSATRYTVDEIDRMRRAVVALGGSMGAEDRLRTYMQNGMTVEELEAAARDHLDPIMRRQKELSNMHDRMMRYESKLNEQP